MIKFEANGKTYTAKVSYFEQESLRPVDGFFVPCKWTEVEISVLENGAWDKIASGVSVCQPDDTFRKDVGRFIAAKNAMRYAYAAKAVEPSQHFAKAILNTFHNPER